jgi:peptide/nickel transport system permease protein
MTIFQLARKGFRRIFKPYTSREPFQAPPADQGELANGSSTVSASQWQLIWRKFRRHKLALGSGILVVLIYFLALFVEFFAPGLPNQHDSQFTYAPPQRLRLFRQTDEGLRFGAYVYALESEIDPERARRVYAPQPDEIIPLGFFVRGPEYEMWGGLFTGRLRFFGPVNPDDKVYLLGADRLGRDVLTRIIYGTRVSMSIGLVGVFISLILGVLLGGVSGYFGGPADTAIQRVIEFVRSIPEIPLWMGLAAAIPLSWPPLRVYFAITVILSLIGWTGLGREVRGRFLSLRGEDFVTAARLDGASELRVIGVHLVPSFMSHIIASLTLAIPQMILSETALSFLGLGLRPPVVSWGVLLQEAQNVRSIANAPWLFWPGVAVIVAVLALNFLGDGLRDAADPYSAH